MKLVTNEAEFLAKLIKTANEEFCINEIPQYVVDEFRKVCTKYTNTNYHRIDHFLSPDELIYATIWYIKNITEDGIREGDYDWFNSIEIFEAKNIELRDDTKLIVNFINYMSSKIELGDDLFITEGAYNWIVQLYEIHFIKEEYRESY